MCCGRAGSNTKIKSKSHTMVKTTKLQLLAFLHRQTEIDLPVFTGSGQVFVKTPHHRAGVGRQVGMIGGFINFRASWSMSWDPRYHIPFHIPLRWPPTWQPQRRPITSKGQVL